MLFSEPSQGVHDQRNVFRDNLCVGSMAVLSSEHSNFAAKSSVCHKLPCVCEELAIFFRIIFHRKHTLDNWDVNQMFFISYYYYQ